MSYIKFDKTQLINLEYSLKRELIRANRRGAYASTTIIGCNTRKYHGLLVCPQEGVDDELHVLLSTLDATVIQREAEFNLGIHCFQGGVYSPKGHKYIKDFDTDPIPRTTYQVGGVVLTMERMFSSEREQMMIRFTLVDCHSPTTLRLKPFLAFRQRHKLTHANNQADRKFSPVPSGIKIRMYPGYSWLHMQLSKEATYTHVPDWFYNFEYKEEKERGYDYLEDLFVPGFFEFPLKKGESIIFSASTEEINPEGLSKQYLAEIKRRVPRSGFENSLKNAAQQFIVRRNKKTEIIAGFPWFGRWGRDTFISLPGLTLCLDDPKTCKAVIDTMLSELNGPLFPNIGAGHGAAYNSVDAPLWFFWALQQYAEYTGTQKAIWKEYGKKMRMILDGYRQGTQFNIHMRSNGLIWAGEAGKALTWMDAVVEGKPVTPRIGMPVEINALWYNAVKFSIEVAQLAGDDDFVNEWEPVAKIIPSEFIATFWSKDKGYLADVVTDEYQDWSMRPNQLIATSLPYSPLSPAKRKVILDYAGRELLTPRGMRTLSPNHPDYQGIYAGDQASRDRAYHQGTVWPWLFGHYAEGYLRVHFKSGIAYIRNWLEAFEETMFEHGIATVSEVYDGNPPFKPGGAISQAWSVAELLRVFYLLKKYDSMDESQLNPCSPKPKNPEL